MKAKMLIFQLGCGLVQVLCLAGCINLAATQHTIWAAAMGATGLITAYSEGAFVGWATERYPHYFK